MGLIVCCRCCCPWSCPFLCSHNLEYDSSEEKKPRLIFYSEKDEVVKVRHTFGDVFSPICLDRRLIRGAAECQVGFTRLSFTTVASDIRSRVWLGRLWNGEMQRKQKEKWEIFIFLSLWQQKRIQQWKTDQWKLFFSPWIFLRAFFFTHACFWMSGKVLVVVFRPARDHKSAVTLAKVWWESAKNHSYE